MSSFTFKSVLVALSLLGASAVVTDVEARPRRGGWDYNGPRSNDNANSAVILPGAAVDLPANRKRAAKPARGGWDFNGPDLTGTRR